MRTNRPQKCQGLSARAKGAFVFSFALGRQLGNQSDITLNPLGVERAVGNGGGNGTTRLGPVYTIMEPTAGGQLFKIAEN